MMTAEYKYPLEPYKGRGTRHTCPQCGKPHELTRYIYSDTGLPIADHVGKCNRQDKCGYHFTPKMYFDQHPRPNADKWRESNLHLTTYTPQAPDYIPAAVMQSTFKDYDQNNFARFLRALLGNDEAAQIIDAYRIGTAKRLSNDGGISCIFWQIDSAGNVRQGKVMGYNPTTGKRLKSAQCVNVWDKWAKAYSPAGSDDVKPRFIGKQVLGKDSNPAQCLFGEHLLPMRPDAVVCIVESEKTACIMSHALPDCIWLATGGANGARWTDATVYAALAGRAVILYPDLGMYDDWSDRAKILNVVCPSVTISDILEHFADDNAREEGYDLADFFIERNEGDEQPDTPPQAPPESVSTIAAYVEPPQEQPTPQRPERAYTLPDGFDVVEFPKGNTVTYNGLPLEWLNDDEHAAAMQILGVRGQLAVMEITNPAVSQLVEVFGLAV